MSKASPALGGVTTGFVFTDTGRLTSVTSPNADTTTFAFDPNGRLTGRTDPLGSSDLPPGQRAETLVRTEVPVVDGLGNPIGTGYAVTHDVARETGHTVATAYRVEFLNTGDQVRTTTLPDTTVQTTVIGLDGSRMTMQPDGVEQSVQQGPDERFGMQAPVGQNTSVTTPVDSLTATVTEVRDPTFDPNDLLNVSAQTERVTVNGRPFTRTYAAAARTFTDTSPEGRQVVTTLDATKDQVIRTQVVGLHPVRQQYDTAGRVTSLKYGPEPDTAATRLTTLTYVADADVGLPGYPAAAKGQLKSTIDALGRVTTFQYDGAGRIWRQLLPGTRTVEFSYDATGNLTFITVPGHLTPHEFRYTPANLPRLYLPPQPSPALPDPSTLYAYNLAGQLARITRPDLQQINLNYDPETGQLDAMTLPGSQQIFYDYSPVTGNLEFVRAPGETIQYTYDGSLPKSETWSFVPPFVGVAGSVSRTYDTSFRVQSQSVNGASTVVFGYDDDDLLTSAGALAPIVPDPQHGLVRNTTLGVVTDATDYTPFGELWTYEARASANLLYAAEHVRDDLGRIDTRTELGVGHPAQGDLDDYDYDSAGRLWQVRRNGQLVAEYLYDLNGNRSGGFNRVVGELLSADYDNQDRGLSTETQLTAVSPIQRSEYTYTANGELQAKVVTPDVTQPAVTEATTYSYDVLGNLTHVTLPTGDQIDYVIDGRNRRVGKKVNGVLTQGWLYDGQLQIVAELDGAGGVVSRFVYATRANVPDYMIRHNDPAPGQSTTYRIISDHLGTPRLVVNANNGAAVQRTDYDEFGNILFEEVAQGFQRLPFGFAGGLYDPDTGLVRFGARDYDPETGRWTEKDPTGLGGADTNFYGYALSDPITFIDSNGRTPSSTIGGDEDKDLEEARKRFEEANKAWKEGRGSKQEREKAKRAYEELQRRPGKRTGRESGGHHMTDVCARNPVVCTALVGIVTARYVISLVPIATTANYARLPQQLSFASAMAAIGAF